MRYQVSAAVQSEFEWIVARTGCHVGADFRAIKAVNSEGAIVGMTAYDTWTANSVQLHVAFKTPDVCRSIIGPSFYYPFVEAKRNIALAYVPSNNVTSLKFCNHIGFQRVYTIHNGFEVGIDVHLLLMKKQDCKWISDGWMKRGGFKHGQKFSAAAA